MSYVLIALFMLGLAQTAGGLLGIFTAISGLRRIKANAGSSHGGIVQTAQAKGTRILRLSAVALVVGLALLSISYTLMLVTAGA